MRFPRGKNPYINLSVPINAMLNMDIRKGEKVTSMLREVDEIISLCREYEKSYQNKIEKVHPDYRFSAINLAHYLAYRTLNAKKLNALLYQNGLLGLQNAREHVMPSLLVIHSWLSQLECNGHPKKTASSISLQQSTALLQKHTKELLGRKGKKRAVRIMVTQPLQAAEDANLIFGMAERGMDVIRINCAHDGEEDWLTIINNAKSLDQKDGIKITMDLAGPKIRTGAIENGAHVLRIKAKRDDLGRTTSPAKLFFLAENRPVPQFDEPYVRVPKELIDAINMGDKVSLRDVRGKKRKLAVQEKSNGSALLEGVKTMYLQKGTKIKCRKNGKKYTIQEIQPVEQYIPLKTGDLLRIHNNQEKGESAILDADGKVLKAAHISCTSTDVFDDVLSNEKVMFDDGKIEGVIKENSGEEILVEITHAKPKGSKLKADKGINFPSSKLNISGLTNKDKKDLNFALKHADVVNMSFVNTPKDVEDLLDEIDALQADVKLGIILKIETMQGVKNIVEILLTAMRTKPVGVMIARGDLAIECGWNTIGIIQEELLKICHAAHLPVVWATQVMENLAKRGIPSRAEITDAMMAQHADCIMLNKGPHIMDAISLLDTILTNVQKVRKNKRGFLREIQILGDSD